MRHFRNELARSIHDRRVVIEELPDETMPYLQVQITLGKRTQVLPADEFAAVEQRMVDTQWNRRLKAKHEDSMVLYRKPLFKDMPVMLAYLASISRASIYEIVGMMYPEPRGMCWPGVPIAKLIEEAAV